MKVEKSIAVLLVASTIVFASFVEAQQQPAQQEAAVAIRSEVQRLWQQAHQLRDQGKLKEAIETTQKMLAKERTLFNRPSADIAVSLEFLAELQVAAEDNAAAEKSLNERLTICAQVFGERDSRTTDTRIELEDVQRIQKMSAEQRRRLAHAERLHAEAREAYAAKNALKTLELETQVLEIRRQLLGENHPDVAVTCSNMALVYLEAKVWDSAERYYRDALRIRRQRLGTTHPVYFESLDELADMLRNHADQLVENEQFTDATAALAEALAIRADRHGVDDWRPRELRVELTHAVRLASLTPEQRKQFERAREVNHEGVNLYNEEKYEQAVEKFEEAVAIRRKLLGVEYSETLTFLQNCAIVAAELGQNGKAEKLFREVTNVRYSLFGTGHAGTRDSIERLANHLEYLGGQQLQRGEFDPAIAKRREVVQLRTILLGQSDYRVGDARRALKHAQTLAGLTEDQREQVKTADQLRETSLSLNAEGKYREALVPCQQALEIRETILGQQHPDTAASLRNLATLYYLLDEYAKAEPLLRENLEIRKQLLGQQHPDTADSISDLARLYAAQGEYSEAESLYQQSLEIRKQALGEEHPDYLTNLDSLATLYASMDKYDEAEQLFRQVLEVRKRVEGEENLDYAQSLSSLAWLYQLMGEFANAEPLYLQLLDIEKKILGDDHPAYAAALDQLTDCYVSMGEFAKAEPLYRQALDIVRKAHGEQHPDYAEGLKKLASYHLLVGEVAKTRSVYRQALDIMKKVHGEQHPDYIETLSRLASTYTMIGDYKEAESSYLRVLELRKKASGEEHADYAESLDALSGFYLLVGDYANAKALARRSLEINKKLLGEEHPLYVKLLSDSTPFYLRFGDYARAEEMLVEALNITKKVVGQQDAAYGTILGNLAGVYVAMGDYEKAEPLFRQALDIISGGGGEEYAFADTAQNLARLYQSMGDYANAETYFRKVLEIKASLLGPQHREYVADLSDVAMVLMHAGDYKNAERLLREALDVAQETLGKQDPSYAVGLNNLALLYTRMAKYDEAEWLFREALEVDKEGLGEDHPNYADCLNNLAMLYASQGKNAKAESLLRQALRVTQTSLDATALGQLDRLQLAMANRLRNQLDNYLSVALHNEQHHQQAFLEVLAWKDAAFVRGHQLQKVTEDGDVAPMFEDLRRTAAWLTTFSSFVNSKDHNWQRVLAHVTAKKQRIEDELNRKSSRFRSAKQQVTLEEIRSALPEDGALVSLLEYRKFKPAAEGEQESHVRSLLGFVVRGAEPIVLLDLGPLAPVTEAIETWRSTFGTTPEGAAAGRLLRKRIWTPLEKHLDGSEVVLISADGGLGRVPFAALPGRKDGTYLLEEYRLAMLPLPQLLPARLGDPSEEDSSGELLLVGDISYDAEAKGAAAARGRPTDSTQLVRGQLTFAPLAGAARELAFMEELYAGIFETKPGDMKRLEKDLASESAIQELAPKFKILHIATHGFFADPSRKSALDFVGQVRPYAVLESERDYQLRGFHPGLLSGLALAGVNRPPEPGQDDGILTAAEIAMLGLDGVKLVVLSNCATGTGAGAGGEGLLGVQRAFQVAGARSTVASLWQVGDVATRRLMERFYRNYWEKEMSKVDALREAQLWLLNHPEEIRGVTRADSNTDEPPKRLSPQFWAAFSLSGDWR